LECCIGGSAARIAPPQAVSFSWESATVAAWLTYTIEVIKNGPYIVKGEVELKDADGNSYPVEKRMALCRWRRLDRRSLSVTAPIP
jgi:hypothetical protein